MSDAARREKPQGAWDVTPTINTPAAEELKLYGTEIKVCGECKFFNRSDAARDDIWRQRFYERLVREEQWKVKYLGSDPRSHGLCDASGGETLTGQFHKACDQYKPRNGLMHIRRKT